MNYPSNQNQGYPQGNFQAPTNPGYPGQNPYSQMPGQPKKSSNAIWWIFGGCGTICVLVCCGGFAGVMWLGATAPETSVYTGNQVPARFIDTMKEVGALEDGESIVYFYSDGITSIKEGFYFVSDRKVVVYAEHLQDKLTIIPFEDIESTSLSRDTSFFEDSQITIVKRNGEFVSFPVSSELDRDVQFNDQIEMRINP